MKETNTKSKKRLIYYLVLAVSVLLLAAATVLTVYFVTSGSGNVLEEKPPVITPDDPTKPDEPNEPNEPSGGEDTVRFVSPIEGGTYKVEYGTIYANRTLGWYYRHKAVDFAADEGTTVRSMADGTVESISYSEETGNIIVIDHGDNLRTYYRFVEPASALRVGASVTKGQTIGAVAAAYGTEKFDGAHLHLEVKLGKVYVDPAVYLDPLYEDK